MIPSALWNSFERNISERKAGHESPRPSRKKNQLSPSLGHGQVQPALQLLQAARRGRGTGGRRDSFRRRPAFPGLHGGRSRERKNPRHGRRAAVAPRGGQPPLP